MSVWACPFIRINFIRRACFFRERSDHSTGLNTMLRKWVVDILTLHIVEAPISSMVALCLS